MFKSAREIGLERQLQDSIQEERGLLLQGREKDITEGDHTLDHLQILTEGEGSMKRRENIMIEKGEKEDIALDLRRRDVIEVEDRVDRALLESEV